jgi:hypothetical protein
MSYYRYHIDGETEMAQDLGEFEYYGIRTVDERLLLGASPSDSREWEDGNVTNSVLDGCCATQIRGRAMADVERALRAHRREGYFGDHTYIVASNMATYGDDPGEIILRDAVVVGII